MITGAELIMGGLALVALLSYPLRRYAVISALAGGMAGAALVIISLRWPLDRVVLVWGRTVLLSRPLEKLGYAWAITEAGRPMLTMLGLTAFAAFIGTRLGSPGKPFVPVGLAVLVLWTGAVIVQPPVGALVGLLAASCLSVFIVQVERVDAVQAAFRQLWWPLLAFALAVIAAWHVQEASFHPDDSTQLQIAAWLMGLSLLLLLAPFPLHSSATSLLAEAPPVVGAFLLVGTQVVVLHLTWATFSGWPWLSEHIEVSRALAVAGLATLLWGALGAVSANRVQRLWAYAALHDWGVFLLGFGLGAPLEWRMAAALFVARALSLFLSAYGIAGIQSRGLGDEWSGVEGLLRRLPWVMLAILVGGLGLAGFPLTASFGPRWALIQTLLRTRPVWGLLVVAGQLGVALGYLRLLQVSLAPLPPTRRLIPRESFPEIVLLTIGVVLSGALALVPQAADGIVQTVISIVVQSGRVP